MNKDFSFFNINNSFPNDIFNFKQYKNSIRISDKIKGYILIDIKEDGYLEIIEFSRFENHLGRSILDRLKNFVLDNNYKGIFLTDESSLNISDVFISLSKLYFLKHGQTWYESCGFRNFLNGTMQDYIINNKINLKRQINIDYQYRLFDMDDYTISINFSAINLLIELGFKFNKNTSFNDIGIFLDELCRNNPTNNDANKISDILDLITIPILRKNYQWYNIHFNQD